MTTYSLTDPLPDRLPMTPPDEPPEPDMNKVDDCSKCGKSDRLAFYRKFLGKHDGEFYLHCFRCTRSGPPAPTVESAAQAWNKWQKE